ncbi:hypothetical protein [Hymenobacter sp. B81]|uniref:hypothetical protein n=1 Tax=Hymenobacter sp. B81 TaxID=3344878 RepID=UPI0037DD9799
MKRFLLAALAGPALLLAVPAALAQRTDSTYVKPQLNTAPPGPPARPPQPTRPAPTTAPVTPAPTTPAAPPSGGIDDDGRPAQALPGQPSRPATPPAPRTGTGIDDDGRPAERLPSTGQVPGAQSAERPPSKYFIYGNLSLGLSSNSVGGVQYNLGGAPALGYRLNKRVAVGPGLVYSYTGYTVPASNSGTGARQNISANNIGLKVFGQVIVIDQFFLHAEYEVTRAQIIREVLTGPNTIAVLRSNATVRTPLLGAGYRQSLGDRAAADIALLYNFNDGLEANIYGQPVIRFSFLFDIGK